MRFVIVIVTPLTAHTYTTFAAKVDCVIMDKTGTLTEGRCGVEGWTYFGKRGKEEDVFYYTWCLEVSSEHPLAVAVVEYCKKRLKNMGSQRGDSVHTPEGWRGVTGMGVEGIIDRKKVAVGNRAFMKLLNVKVPQKIGESWRVAIHVNEHC